MQFYLKTHEKDQLQDYEFYLVKGFIAWSSSRIY